MSPNFFTEPGTLVSAAALEMEHHAVSTPQLVHGSPTTATAALGVHDGIELGVWEMTAGAMSDVEVDEVFIVLSGTATVQMDAFDSLPARTLSLKAGDIVQLREGMRTVWTVTETIRKVYLA